MNDCLLVGFLDGISDVGFLVLHELGLVQVRVDSEWLEFAAGQPLPGDK